MPKTAAPPLLQSEPQYDAPQTRCDPPPAVPPRSGSAAVAPGVPMWRGTVLSLNDRGYEDAYAIGLDGYVWTYQIDGATGRTGRLICTWLKASTFALATLPGGRALLVGGDNGTLYYVQENGSSNIWWTRPVAVSLPVGVLQSLGISNIIARWVKGVLYVVVDTRHQGMGGELVVQSWESIWECRDMTVVPSPWRLTSTTVRPPDEQLVFPLREGHSAREPLHNPGGAVAVGS